MSKNTAPQPRAKKTAKSRKIAADEPIPYRPTEPPADPAPRPRTARDLYAEAVRARLGVGTGPNALRVYDRPDEMTPGEMLLWALGGVCFADELFEGIFGAAHDLRRVEVTHDTCADGSLGEHLEGVAMRLEIIARIHRGALQIMGGIQLEGGTA